MTKLHILAVGRLRKGPELSLVSDYLDRAEKAGRNLGLSVGPVIEVEDKRGGGMAGEAEVLRKAVPKSAVLCVLDERGKLLDSRAFAGKIESYRDQGVSDIVFIIGGADGIDPSLRAEADMALSLGKMVWPHMLARVMLSEQIYRAVSILAGSPYHRD